MPRFEVLECPRLPRGYSLRITIERDPEGRAWAHTAALTTPATGNTNLTPGGGCRSNPWLTRGAALTAATRRVNEHLNARRAIHPVAVRNVITTWLGTLIKPDENEQPL